MFERLKRIPRTPNSEPDPHGRSSAKAVRNGVAIAYRFAADRFIRRAQDDIPAAVNHQ